MRSGEEDDGFFASFSLKGLMIVLIPLMPLFLLAAILVVIFLLVATLV